MSLTKSTAAKELLKLSLPIMFGQLGIMLIATGDMIIAGRYSLECLAAIGLAVSMANPTMMLGLGILFAVSPILAQKRGRGEDVYQYYWSVIYFSLFIGLVCMFMTMLSIQLLPYFGYSENLNVLIREYLWITSFSTITNCLYQGVKEFLQSQEKTISANLVAIIAVGLNLFFNYAFAFGEYGMPNLKEAGLAWASLALRCFMGFAMLFITYKTWKFSKTIKWDFLKEVVKLGGPVTMSIFFEVMAFCSVTLFVGKFSEVQTAANNLALNVGSLAFMIPLAMSAAVAVKVGHAYGEKDFAKVRTYGFSGLMISVSFVLLMGAGFYSFPEFILSIYNSDPAVLEWGKRLLFWVACFQLFDGSQVTLSGILRGLSVTRAPSMAIFFGYWIIGIPLGYYLAFYRGLEAQGFWIGLALSLAVVALMLGGILKRTLGRLHA